MKELDRKKRAELVIRLFHELESTRLVSDTTGIPWKTVSYILNSNGVKTPRVGRRHNPYSACDRNEELLLKMNAEGCSLLEMGKAVGTTGKSVKKFLARKNLLRDFPKTKSGEKHYMWKGHSIDKDGYRLIHVKGHPNARKHSNWIFEHRLVMEEVIGRYLLPNEVVHHIDGNKLNNDPSNLRLFESNGEHLAVDLAGRCPKWSPEGYARICATVRRNADLKRKPNLPE